MGRFGIYAACSASWPGTVPEPTRGTSGLQATTNGVFGRRRISNQRSGVDEGGGIPPQTALGKLPLSMQTRDPVADHDLREAAAEAFEELLAAWNEAQLPNGEVNPDSDLVKIHISLADMFEDSSVRIHSKDSPVCVFVSEHMVAIQSERPEGGWDSYRVDHPQLAARGAYLRDCLASLRRNRKDDPEASWFSLLKHVP